MNFIAIIEILFRKFINFKRSFYPWLKRHFVILLRFQKPGFFCKDYNPTFVSKQLREIVSRP